MPSDAEIPDSGGVEIRFTPEFKRNLRALAKKYRHIRSDIEPVLEQLQKGRFLGDQVPHTGYTIYKARVQNRDLRKGKRAGYRLIYYLQTKTRIILITIYSKTEQSDISANQVRQIINEFEKIDLS
jgi:mRNA-degrading endonuclease RelE of RelBE toxin-antitoxin system